MPNIRRSYPGKSLPQQESDSSSEEEEEVYYRGGGKQLSGGKGFRGKALRVMPQDDSDESNDDEDFEETPVAPVARPGGKTLSRPPPDSDDDLDDDDDDEDEDKVVMPVPRGGGKTIVQAAGGKQLRPSPGKQLARAPQGGKTLRRQEESSEEEEDFAAEESSEEDDDFEEAVVPETKPKRGRPSRAAASKKSIIEEDDDDEEEESSDEEMEMDIDMNNPETLIKDEEDRKYLDSLPELEREAILAERFDKLKQEQDMKRDLRAAKKATKAPRAQPKKKKPAAKKVDTTKIVTGKRNKDASGAKNKKMQALAALKKEKKAQKAATNEDSESEDDFGDDSDSDSDFEEGGALKPWQKKKAAKSTVDRLDKEDDDMEVDEESEEEETERRAPKKVREGAPEKEAALNDFLKVTIPRRRLKRWCNMPYFTDAVVGCFVRLFIGENPDTGEKTYRLCEIMGVEEGTTSYKFPVADRNEVPVMTKLKLILRFCQNEKEFPMYLVSDANPDEIDVAKYVTTQKGFRGEVISKRECNRLKRVRDELVNNYRYSQQDIQQQLKQRKEDGKATGTLGLEQTRANIALQAAKDGLTDAEEKVVSAKKALIERVDESETEKLKKDVEDAEALVETFKKKVEDRTKEFERLEQVLDDRKQRLKKRDRDQAWAKVNKRSLQMNQTTDFNSTKIQESANTKKKGEFDPYARRKVKPKILWEVGQDEDEKKEESKADGDKAVEAAENSSAPNLVQEGSAEALMTSESHQFAIDEEDLAQSSTALILGKRKPNKTRVRKGISLNEYMERKAAGTL